MIDWLKSCRACSASAVTVISDTINSSFFTYLLEVQSGIRILDPRLSPDTH